MILPGDDTAVAGRLVLARRQPAGRRARVGILRVHSTGRMRVILNVHGGQRALADVLEGHVARNERALREQPDRVMGLDGVRRVSDSKVWRDIPSALHDRAGSNGTMAAAETAKMRLRGYRVRLGFNKGLPTIFDEGTRQPLRSFNGPTYDYPQREGRVDERMIYTIDDDKALPVREVNQAIAIHNAGAIMRWNLPALYSGRISYKVEGSPELWWDAKEIADRTYDDCEGLVAYRVGELILKGYDADVYTRLIARPSKEMGGSGKPRGRLFHAIVRVNTGPDGAPVVDRAGRQVFDDPSMRLGMPVPSWYQEMAKKMRAEGKSLG